MVQSLGEIERALAEIRSEISALRRSDPSSSEIRSLLVRLEVLRGRRDTLRRRQRSGREALVTQLEAEIRELEARDDLSDAERRLLEAKRVSLGKQRQALVDDAILLARPAPVLRLRPGDRCQREHCRGWLRLDYTPEGGWELRCSLCGRGFYYKQG